MNDVCHTKLIDQYLDDSLSPQDEVVLEQHLETCIACQRTMAHHAGSHDEWQQITTALRIDEFDVETDNEPPFWPLSLLGPTDDPRMLGRIGPFEVSACVGIGGMGVVFKARDPALDRFVAVKVLSPQLAASETARIRFAREAKAAATVVHDNVIAVHQVSTFNQLPYLVMPYLPGPSLEQRLRRNGPMPVVDALRIAKQVAAGLAAAHQQNLIHRDIKPANILLSRETERAVLTDFGLARAVDDASLTRTGVLAGTPQFMAPEQARGEATDVRSDIFSLGALLFAMLAGAPAVQHLSGTETVRKVGSHAPPDLSNVMEDVPKWLRGLLNSLHAFAPSDRIESAAQAEQAIAGLLAKASERPLKRRDKPIDHAAGSRRRTRIVATAAAGLLCMAAAWLLTSSSARERGNRQNVSANMPLTQNIAADSSGNISKFSDKKPEQSMASHTNTVDTSARSRPAAVPETRTVTAAEISQLLSDPQDQQLNTEFQSINQHLEALENR